MLDFLIECNSKNVLFSKHIFFSYSFTYRKVKK